MLTGFSQSRRSTAAPPTRRPKCWCGTRRPRSTSASAAYARRPATCAPRSPTATASTPTTTSRSSSAPSTTAARRWCSPSTRSACRADGALVEGAAQQRRRLQRRSTGGREATDLAPTSSSSRRDALTEYGYEVEIRIPFKSLRYQSTDRSRLGAQRHPARAAARGTRTAGRRPRAASASFLAQSGTLDGPHRPAARPRARPQPGRDRAARRRARRRRRLGLRRGRGPSSAATCAGASRRT